MQIIMRRTPLAPAPPPPSGSISLSTSDIPSSVAQGFNTARFVTLTRTTYTGTVTLVCEGLPTGVTCTFDPANSTSGNTVFLLSLFAAEDADLVTDEPIIVRAAGSGVLDATTSFDLTVIEAGALEWLRPRDINGIPTVLAVGMTFNNNTGQIEGSAVNTTKPTYVNTYPLSDLGDPEDNWQALQDAIDDLATTATANTVITVPSGFVVRIIPFSAESIRLRNQSHDFWIGFQLADMTSIPACSPGQARGTYLNRIEWSALGTVPEFQFVDFNIPLLSVDEGAHHYYFDGFAVTNPDGQTCTGGAFILNNPFPAVQPHHIIFEHWLCDGGNTASFFVQRMFYVAGNNMAFMDGAIRNTGYTESQAIWGYGSSNGVRIHNNDLRDMCGGAGEVIMTGDSANTGMIYNWEITGNYIASRGNAKAGIEVKKGAQFTIDGNIFGTNTSGNPQNAHIFLRTTENGGIDPETVCKNITVSNNFADRGPGFCAVAGVEFSPGLDLEETNSICLVNNLGYGFVYGVAIPVRSWGIRINKISMIANTLIGSDFDTHAYQPCYALENSDSDPAEQSFDFWIKWNVMVGPTSNIAAIIQDRGGVFAGHFNDTVFAETFKTSEFATNLVSFNYQLANQIQTTSVADMKFVDFDNDDYELAFDSPGITANPVGGPVGYQKTLFDTIISRVLPP